jgi:hypothetical protein
MTLTWHRDRGGNPQILELLPFDENDYYRWNGNPFELAAGGGGTVMHDPGAWLFPYWLGVYKGWIVNSTSQKMVQ